MRWLLLLLCSCMSQAVEAKSPPPLRLTYQDMVAARNNPIGLMNLIEVTGRYRLSQSDHMLMQDTHISAGPFFDLNPAAAALGGVVRVKPLAVLQLTASHAWVGYFGTFGLVQSFDDSRVDYSDTQLDINEDNGENFSTTGTTTKLEGILQAKAGPVAVRSTFLGTRYSLDTRGKPIWFDTGLDVLAPRRGWVIKNDLDVLWVTDVGLAAGGRWPWTKPFLGKFSEDSQTTDRMGPMVAYRWGKAPGSRFHAPTVILLAQWYTRHAYRTGEDVSQGLPYLAAAFIFSGDLIPW